MLPAVAKKTKPNAAMTQLAAMYLVGLNLAQVRGTRDADEVRSHYRDLAEIPELIASTLARMDGVRKLAREISSAERVLFLGRHVGYPTETGSGSGASSRSLSRRSARSARRWSSSSSRRAAKTASIAA